MKKQHDLILLAPEEFSNYYSLVPFKKNSIYKANHKTISRKKINHPFSTEYEALNMRKITPIKRINIKKIFPQKIFPLPIISKNGLLYNTNRLLTINKNSLEGYKPIEDNKIRNKFKAKNINNPLSIHYFSLKEKSNQFDQYVISLLKKNKNNYYKESQRYAT